MGCTTLAAASLNLQRSQRHELRARKGSRLFFNMAHRILAAVVFMALSPSWIHFPSAWIPSREYGFVACGLAIWHLAQVRQQLVGWAPEPVAWMLLPLASMAWWAALSSNIQVGHLLLVPGILFLWIGATSGRKALKSAYPAFLVFLVGVPVWELLNPLLQWMAVLVSQAVLGALGIEATIRGTSIFLSSGIIEVADSCSGLHFLMVGLTIAASYAFFFARRRRTQGKIVALAVLLAIFANWVRVVGLVLIGEATRMRSPLLADHELYGWIIFAVALICFFPLALRIERRESLIVDKVDSSESASVKPPQPSQSLPAYAVRRAILATGLAVMGPILGATLALAPSIDQLPTTPVPFSTPLTADIDSVSSQTGWRPSFLGATHRIFRSTRTEAPVRIDQFWYSRQEQGAELIGEGNQVAPDSIVVRRRLVGPLDDSFRMVQETVVRADSSYLIVVWSFYRVGGVETSSTLKAKLLQIPATLRRRDDAEAILVSTTCEPSKCADAVQTLYVALTGKEPPAGNATAGK